MSTYRRSTTPTGVPIYEAVGTAFTIEGTLAGPVMENRMVFGRWTGNSGAAPRVVAWRVYRDGRFVYEARTLREAKQAVERRVKREEER